MFCTIAGDNFRFNLLRDVRQRGTAVGRGEFDSVVFRRIVRGGEIDHAVRFVVDYGMGKRRSGRGFGDHQRRDSVRRQNLRRHRAESFAQKPRIASHDDPRPLRLLRCHVARDPAHGARTLAKVNSSAITARHPDVPNLICVSMNEILGDVECLRPVAILVADDRRPKADFI